MDYYKLRKASSIIRAIDHTLRQQIIEVINENERIKVTEIYVKLRIVQAVASYHLGLMRKANVVTAMRDGKFIYYSLNHGKIKSITELINNLLINKKVL